MRRLMRNEAEVVWDLSAEPNLHAGDQRRPSNRQSISPASAGNDRGFYGRRRLYDGGVLARHEART